MFAVIGLLAFLAVATANPAILRVVNDGQWHPELDGSAIGSGYLRWGLEDGSWKPELDGSWLGRGDLVWLNRRKREINPNSIPQPADEPVVAYAKNAQLRQQASEGARNILGGGIPTDLPADTPEVAAGKQAHAIAHENQKLLTSGVHHITPLVRADTRVIHVPGHYFQPPVHHVAPVVARVAQVASPLVQVTAPVAHVTTVTRSFTPITHVATPVAHIATPVAHVATPVAHIATPVVRAYSPYHYAYTPVVEVFKKK